MNDAELSLDAGRCRRSIARVGAARVAEADADARARDAKGLPRLTAESLAPRVAGARVDLPSALSLQERYVQHEQWHMRNELWIGGLA